MTITEKLIEKIKSLKVYLEGKITTKTQEVNCSRLWRW